MTKAQWLLAASPSIALLVLLLFDLVPNQWGVIYVALAFLQGAFLLAATKRVRRNVANRGIEQTTMPLWQKVVFSAIAIYGLLLVFIGALTQQ
jgi:hypothetical protein